MVSSFYGGDYNTSFFVVDSNLDIRAAILQLVNVIRDGSKKSEADNFKINKKLDKIQGNILYAAIFFISAPAKYITLFKTFYLGLNPLY